MPKGLTAATGMDALTHAIEGYITKGHCTISDMFHLEAIRLISENLRGAVQNTPEGREGMALGQYIAGMGFSNVGLGIVHSMAHGLSALYDTPHGVACAILLPVGLEYNKPAAAARYRAVGKAMGVAGIDAMTEMEAADATIAAVKQLSADVGIPANLQGILKEEDIRFLAESAFADACCPGNPRDTSVEESWSCTAASCDLPPNRLEFKIKNPASCLEAGFFCVHGSESLVGGLAGFEDVGAGQPPHGGFPDASPANTVYRISITFIWDRRELMAPLRNRDSLAAMYSTWSAIWATTEG